MPDFLPTYVVYLLTAALGCIISIYGVRKTIFIARSRKLYDKPDDIRKIHGAEIPSMGGIGIFVGYVVASAVYWYWCGAFLPFFMASSALLLFTGIYDDIMNMRPVKKLLAQLVASALTVSIVVWQFDLQGQHIGNVLIFLLYTLFITLCCTFFVNVFNFIDGIDGLACSLATLYLVTIGLLLFPRSQVEAGLAFTLAGATCGLLFFNKAPAKIYMGDTGSMFIGFSVFVLALIYVTSHNNDSDLSAIWIPLNTVAALLFVPVFDALRVFALRISRKTSPLKADRTHLHYYLLDAGCTHTQAVAVIVATNILCMAAAFVMRSVHPVFIVSCCVAINAAVLMVVLRARKKRLGKRQ